MAWTYSYSDARGCSGYEYDAAGNDITPEAVLKRILRKHRDGESLSWITEYEYRTLSAEDTETLLESRRG